MNKSEWFRSFSFGYMYYRLFHLNSGKDEIQGFPAVLVISLVQSLYMAGFCKIIILTILSRTEFAPYVKTTSSIAVFVLIGLMIFNGFHYSKHQDELLTKFVNETKMERVIKGILIALVCILSFVPLVII